MKTEQIRWGLYIFLLIGAAFVRAQEKAFEFAKIDTVSSTPEKIYQTQAPGFGSAVVKTIVTLAVILSIVYLLAMLFKRIVNKGQISGTIPISIVGSKLFGPKKAIYIIDIEERRFVVGVSDSSISKIAELEKTVETSGESPDKQDVQPDHSFGKLLSLFVKKGES